jgi:aspartate racemase
VTRVLGIVGGIAPGSTVDYYRQIIAAYREQRPDGSYPGLLINSIDLTRMLGLVETGQRDELVAYLGNEVERLARGGASLGLLASNTPHIVFDKITARCSTPLLSIVPR